MPSKDADNGDNDDSQRNLMDHDDLENNANKEAVSNLVYFDLSVAFSLSRPFLQLSFNLLLHSLRVCR